MKFFCIIFLILGLTAQSSAYDPHVKVLINKCLLLSDNEAILLEEIGGGSEYGVGYPSENFHGNLVGFGIPFVVPNQILNFNIGLITYNSADGYVVVFEKKSTEKIANAINLNNSNGFDQVYLSSNCIEELSQQEKKAVWPMINEYLTSYGKDKVFLFKFRE